MRFNIEGEPMPVVVCELESGEMMITEKGARSWMSPNMQMNTVGGQELEKYLEEWLVERACL